MFSTTASPLHSFSSITTEVHSVTIDDIEYPIEHAGVDYITPRVKVNDDGTHTVSYAIDDTDPSEYEWAEVLFFNGESRCVSPATREDVEAMPHVFGVERYSHGLVRYSLVAESSAVDRQWDVAIVGLIGIPEDFTNPEAAARAYLDEYTNWCNGEVYGVSEDTFIVVEGESVAFPHPDIEPEVCWGIIGSEYAQKVVDGEA